MLELDEIGDSLMIEKGVDPQHVKKIAEERCMSQQQVQPDRVKRRGFD
jgi:hypothetical protein